MIQSSFWKGKRVLITGHTGFKGSWLSIWLHYLGAKVSGLSLKPNTTPSMFELTGLEQKITSIYGDITDINIVKHAFDVLKPEIVIHMAAQTLVRYSYENPLETYRTNILGLINVFEIIKSSSEVKVVLNITSDKCYQNNAKNIGFRENDPMGGNDPYSCSKGCAELITSSYRQSFFDHKDLALASARAGNVIGGGDWAQDRLIPDIIKAFMANETVVIRNPNAIRPWQHVLEPLSGYLILCQKLYLHGSEYAQGWNFGPVGENMEPVSTLVKILADQWYGQAQYKFDTIPSDLHEAHCLRLDSSKSNSLLSWSPYWSLQTALEKTVHWYQAYQHNENVYNKTLEQIQEYMQQYD
ncbi:MAG: CDP-glucose 4,6-dehydratase [Pseudomonadota bacterium]